jgi:hypothetical protein
MLNSAIKYILGSVLKVVLCPKVVKPKNLGKEVIQQFLAI